MDPVVEEVHLGEHIGHIVEGTRNAIGDDAHLVPSMVARRLALVWPTRVALAQALVERALNAQVGGVVEGVEVSVAQSVAHHPLGNAVQFVVQLIQIYQGGCCVSWVNIKAKHKPLFRYPKPLETHLVVFVSNDFDKQIGAKFRSSPAKSRL